LVCWSKGDHWQHRADLDPAADVYPPSYVDTRSDFRADSRSNWSLQARHLIVEWCDPDFAGFSDAGG
jgi:hypothetical protein